MGRYKGYIRQTSDFLFNIRPRSRLFNNVLQHGTAALNGAIRWGRSSSRVVVFGAHVRVAVTDACLLEKRYPSRLGYAGD